MADLSHRILSASPITLADGASVVVDARGFAVLTVIPEEGATTTVSRVDSLTASEHADPDDEFTDLQAINVDWPFYLISSAGGATRVALAAQ